MAVSPYHLTTREAPAVAALQLAESVVTLLPAPATGRTREDVETAVRKSPRYLRMLDSWRWTMPLWHEGVITSAHAEQEIADDLRLSYDRIGADDDFAPLRPLTRHASDAKPEHFLDLLSGDILKGGPDPGLNIPVSAAIDGFACRHDLVVARAAATSIAQRAETRLGTRAFGVAVPVLLHASARLILRVRDELSDELNELRGAISGACKTAADCDRLDENSSTRLTLAARRYTAAFEKLRARLEGKDDDEGVRITTGYVSLVGMVLPIDVAMRSGLAAVRSMNPSMSPRAAAARKNERIATTPERLPVLIIKPMNARPDAGNPGD